MHKRTIFTKEELSQMLEGKEVVYKDEKIEYIYCMEKETVKKKFILCNVQEIKNVRDQLDKAGFPAFRSYFNELQTEHCTIRFERDGEQFVRGYRPDSAFCFGPDINDYFSKYPNIIIGCNLNSLIAYVISIENGTAEKELAKSFELMREGLITVKEFTELFPEFADSHNGTIIIASKREVESEKPTPLTKKETIELFSGKKTPNQIRVEHGLPPLTDEQLTLVTLTKEFVPKKTELVLTNNHEKVLKRGNAAVLAEVIHISQDIGCIPTMKYSEKNKYMELYFEGYFNNFTLYIKEE